MTRTGWTLVAGVVALVATGRILALPELYVLGAVGGALVILALVSVRGPTPEISVTRNMEPPRVHVGAEARIHLTITHDRAGRRRSPTMHLLEMVEGTSGVRVSLAPMKPDSRVTTSYRLPTRQRGKVTIGPLLFTRVDGFGLAARTTIDDATATLTVLPPIETLPSIPDGGGYDHPLGVLARPIPANAGDEDFATLRPYAAGDDLRRIHWPSSARRGDLLVRQDDPPWQGNLTVILDARADHFTEASFESAVTAAASLFHAMAQRSDRARLVITDGTDTGLTSARSSRITILEHLALVERGDHGDLRVGHLASDRRTGTAVVITGELTADDLIHLRGLAETFVEVQVISVVDRPDDEPAPTSSTVSGLTVLTFGARTPFARAWGMRR